MRFRLYPTAEQGRVLSDHCAKARFVWNLAVEQHSHWQPGRTSGPAWSEQCRQLTAARAEHDWLRDGNVDVQQQALKDYQHARTAFFQSGFGKPTWRRKYQHEGFRVIGTDRAPEFHADGTAALNSKGKQVMARRMRVEKVNRRNGRMKIPGAGWVRFRLSRRQVPSAKTARVTWKNGQWHIAFTVKPEGVDTPGNGETVGLDRGVAITAACSDGTQLNCPQPSAKERAKRRKHERRAARAPKQSQRKTDEHTRAAKLKAREANVRKDWCEQTSTMLARNYDRISFEGLRITTMTRSAKGTVDKPGTNVHQKAGLNRSILAQGWGLLRSRTDDKATGRVYDVPARNTSLRCSDCGWIDKNSRKNQAEFVCSACGFSINADTNAAINVDLAAGRCRRDDPAQPESVREPHPA